MTHDVTYQPRRPPERAPFHLSKRTWLFLGLLAINAAVFIYYGDPRTRLPPPQADKAAKPSPTPARSARTGADGSAALDPTAGIRTPGPVQKVTTVGLRPGQNVAQALLGAGIAAPEVTAAVASLSSLVDFRRLKPGHELRARLDAGGSLLSLDVRRGPADQIRTEKQDSAWRAARLDIPVNTVRTVVRGQVQSSLWEAMEQSGEDPRLAIDVADIFAWDIDFYTDLHPGDSFVIVVDKCYVEGKFVSYGPIAAARFVTDGTRHEAFLHHGQGSAAAIASYFDADGQSLRKQLLKSPLKYGHITSGFGMRVHPILGYSRAHNGIDYGAPVGTQVWAVGDGRVTKAGWVDGYGNYVELHHANGWESEYGHLSRILVHTGQRIGQKDVIALSGSTGLSTGPHLHYGLKLNGHFVDPSRQKFERAKPLDGEEKQRFDEEVRRLRGELDDGRIAHWRLPGEAQKG